MSSAHLTRWVQDWGPLITLASAVLLTIVTAWLAWVTMRMAAGAKDAAEHSKIAAEATLATAATIQASASVEFTLSTESASTASSVLATLKEAIAKDPSIAESDVESKMFDSIMAITEVNIRCDGAAVYVHGGHIVQVCREGKSVNVTECEAEQIELKVPPGKPPRRLHKDEWLSFEVTAFQPGERVVSLVAVIDYSFDGQRPLHQRVVQWRAKPRKNKTIKGIVRMGAIPKKSDRE